MSFGISTLEIGMVIRSFRDDVDPKKVKYWIIVGISEDGESLASVLINSRIHPFIMRKTVLLNAQFRLDRDSRQLVDYTCYADCSQVKEKGVVEIEALVAKKPHYIKGLLYPEEIDSLLNLILGCPKTSEIIKNRYGFR